MATYRATTHLPPLVCQAMELARHMGFEHACTVEVGRLLHVLARHCQVGVVAEIGTGCGVGAAWIVSALAPGASFVTVEVDASRAAAAQSLFAAYPTVRVLHGDWHDIAPHGPFVLLFADTNAKQHEPDLLVQLLRPGGISVLDDLTPHDQLPPDWRGKPDPIREFWLNDPRLAATELLVTSSHAVILATRLS